MIKDHMEIIAEHGVTRLELSQLRMQALELIVSAMEQIDQYKELKDKTPFNVADMFVHYCLTGEHKLPEKKG